MALVMMMVPRAVSQRVHMRKLTAAARYVKPQLPIRSIEKTDAFGLRDDTASPSPLLKEQIPRRRRLLGMTNTSGYRRLPEQKLVIDAIRPNVF